MTFRYDTTQDSSDEMLEVAAAGYEAVDAGNRHFSTALKTTFREAEPLQDYRDAAESVFSEVACEWRKSKGLPE